MNLKQMRIRKVKWTGTRIQIAYEIKSERGYLWDEYSLNCGEPAKNSFYQALKDLAAHVVEMCELPPLYQDRIEVKSVSYSYGGDKDVMGANISAAMILENSYQPLNINTPHKAAEMHNDQPDDDKQLLTDDCHDALMVLQEECKDYIEGDRVQGSLFPVNAA